MADRARGKPIARRLKALCRAAFVTIWTACGCITLRAQTSALPEAPSAVAQGEVGTDENALAATLPGHTGPEFSARLPTPGVQWVSTDPPEVLRSSNQRPTVQVSPKVEPDRGTLDQYQWRGLLWQSVEFNVAENGFRVSADSVMRDTLAHKPFWHDYIASMQQMNMRRWNDGDTFIVNYIGHSMHGAVAADLEIQNSPTDARIQWGDPGYVRSRFKGFLWATVFSTHSEISPAGEPGIGNEGGFTYGVNCQFHCNSTNFKPGDHYTNNTGWVDFIVSPTAGMVWVVTEDLLDRYVNERLMAEHPGRFWPKVVRSSLNPSRSFANMLRWRQPWYRDFEQAAPEPSRVYWFPPEDEQAWRRIPQFQLAPFYSRFSIATNTPSCFNCRETAIGGGVQATTHIQGWLSFDSAWSYHPGASALPSDRAGGNMTVAVFGLAATRQWHYYAVHLAVRPGLVHYSRAYLTSPKTVIITTYPPGIATHGGDADSVPGPGVVDANGQSDEPQLGDITHFVWDFHLSGDYRLTSKLAFRVGIDDEVVRYRTDKVDAPGIGSPPYLSWLSKKNFINRGNVSMQMGPVFSF